MTIRTAPLLALVLASAAILAGCTPTVTVTVPASDIADAAEGALEQTVGSRPDIDCGTDEITLKKGAVVDCVLTDPVTGEKFEAPVTISKVDGADYSIDVQVADKPIAN